MINPKVFKQVRKALGLSQQELADALGLSRVTINKMERGKLRRGIPDEIAARLLALKPKVNVKPLKIRDQEHYDSLKEAGDKDLWDNDEEDDS